VHESAAVLLAEMHRAGSAHVEGAVEVHPQHVRPVRPAHAMEDTVAQNAGVVDQHIDPAKGGECGLDDLLGVLRLGDGERGSDRLTAAALDLVHHLVGGRGIGAGAFEARADVADDDAPTLAGHRQRNAAADAPSGAGDNCDFPRDDPAHPSPTPRPRPRRCGAASPIARPRSANCPPPSKRSRIGRRCRAAQAERILRPRRCGA
jgi:hypothetical protein